MLGELFLFNKDSLMLMILWIVNFCHILDHNNILRGVKNGNEEPSEAKFHVIMRASALMKNAALRVAICACAFARAGACAHVMTSVA